MQSAIVCLNALMFIDSRCVNGLERRSLVAETLPGYLSFVYVQRRLMCGVFFFLLLSFYSAENQIPYVQHALPYALPMPESGKVREHGTSHLPVEVDRSRKIYFSTQ